MLGLPSTLVLLSSLYVAGCALAGERAVSGCPAGETCSNQTPGGLFFLGRPTSDNIFGGGFLPTAAGGTQTVTVVTGQDADSPEFTGTFDAKSADTGVFTINGQKPPTITLRGQKDGSTFLRLVEPGTNNLLDRVTTEVQSIATVSLYPNDLVAVTEKEAEWALLAGSTAPVVVELHGKGGDRLVDETLSIKGKAGTATSTAWDRFDLTPPSSGDAAFTVSAGGGTFEVQAKVVEKIDTIDQTGLFGSEVSSSNHVAVGSDQILCFIARSGGVATAGAKWTYTLSGGLKLPASSTTNLDTSSCTTVHAETAGPASVTVAAGGVTKTIDVTIDPKAAGSLLRFPKHEATPAAGERAGGGAEE